MQEVPLLIRCMENCLKIFAIYVNPEHKKWEKLYFYTYTIFIFGLNELLYIVYMVQEAKSYGTFIDVLAYNNGALCLYLVLCSAQINRKHFIKCYENVLKANNYVNEEFYQLANEDIRTIFIRIMVVMMVCLAGLSTNPLLIAGFTDEELGSPTTLIAPHKYPWDMSTHIGYAVSILYQGFYCSVAISLFIGMAVFILLNWIVLRSHYKILKRKIERLDDTVDIQDKGSKAYRHVKLEALHDVFRYHRYLNT